MGLLYGRRGSEGVGTREVVGVLHTAARWVTTRDLAHRHQQRALPGERRNARGGVRRPAGMTDQPRSVPRRGGHRSDVIGFVPGRVTTAAGGDVDMVVMVGGF